MAIRRTEAKTNRGLAKGTVKIDVPTIKVPPGQEGGWVGLL